MTQDTTLSADDWQRLANAAGLGIANGYNLWAHYTDTLTRLVAAEAAVYHAYGSFHVSTPAATTITTPGTFYKSAGTTVSGTNAGFTMPVNNRLTYTGTDEVHLQIAVNMSVTCADNAQIAAFAVYKNGVQLLPSLMTQRMGTGTDVQIVTIHADCDLLTDGYIELYCTNQTSTAALTLQYAYVHAMALPLHV